MAKYYITAIDKHSVGSHNYITRVILHEVSGNTVIWGQIKSKDEVIKLLKANNTVYSAMWDYKNCAWDEGEPVTYLKRGDDLYLRTEPDFQKKDNLLHLLPLSNLAH